MRKKMAFVLAFSLLFAAFLPCAAAEPAVPRVYRPEMRTSAVCRDGEYYIALDVVINDITEPTGLLGIEFNIHFDGDALIPLWQTEKELNGDGKGTNTFHPPQMITKWPMHTLKVGGKDIEFVAAEGLCKSYQTTGKGVLNVNLLLTDDMYVSPVFGDGEMAIRLYFKPAVGFKAGIPYCFSIDGQYDETIPQRVLVRGVNGAKMPGNAYGYGAQASYAAVRGDIDCDGIVSVMDYVLLKNALCGANELDSLQTGAADLNDDGTLTTTDALQFRRLFKSSF